MKRPMFKDHTFHNYPLKKALRQKHWGAGKIGESEQVKAEIDHMTPQLTKITFCGLIINNIDPFKKKEKTMGI